MKFWVFQLEVPSVLCVKTAKPLKNKMMQKNASAAYALHGWNLLLNGS